MQDYPLLLADSFPKPRQIGEQASVRKNTSGQPLDIQNIPLWLWAGVGDSAGDVTSARGEQPRRLTFLAETQRSNVKPSADGKHFETPNSRGGGGGTPFRVEILAIRLQC